MEKLATCATCPYGEKTEEEFHRGATVQVIPRVLCRAQPEWKQWRLDHWCYRHPEREA